MSALPELHRSVLGNGLRVLVQPLPGVPRVAVAVHYGVGYRSEPPGREGFAHLFEHLMFRGSERLPGGRFNDHVHRLGGRANGTTHQDYTDYYQATPVRALDEALFAEADRMRAPLFTEESLAEQLRGVAAEIRETVTDRPYGGLPWPLLSGVLFDTYANAHDGYGDAEALLRRTAVEDCEDFFRAHYAPGNAVLTLVGGVSVEGALASVERHFGGIPARPFAAPSPARLDEPPLREDRWAVSPGREVPRTALALGLPLPDPATRLRGHLAYAVLARMLARYAGSALGYPSASASCGFFGPLDAWAPDPLVVLATLPEGTPARTASRDLAALCASWAEDRALPALVSRAQGALAIEHARTHADIQCRARALGRLELLFGHAELLDELPGLIGALGAEEVAEAARDFATSPKAHVVRERTRGPSRVDVGAGVGVGAGSGAGGGSGTGAGSGARAGSGAAGSGPGSGAGARAGSRAAGSGPGSEAGARAGSGTGSRSDARAGAGSGAAGSGPGSGAGARAGSRAAGSGPGSGAGARAGSGPGAGSRAGTGSAAGDRGDQDTRNDRSDQGIWGDPGDRSNQSDRASQDFRSNRSDRSSQGCRDDQDTHSDRGDPGDGGSRGDRSSQGFRGDRGHRGGQGEGPLVVAVSDHRADVVELALRLPLPSPTWHTERRGDGLVVTSDGEGLTVTGYAEPGRVREYLRALAAALRRPFPAAPPRLPVHRLDHAVRQRWPAGATGPPGRPVLCAVGALDPGPFREEARAAFAGLRGLAVTPGSTAPLPAHQDDAVRLVLCGPEPATPTSEAARYLATAAYAGFTESRLFRSFAPWNAEHPGAAEVHAGRDLMCGAPRAYVRAKVAPDRAEEALDVLRDEARRLVHAPLTEAELAHAREFCAAQLLSAYDSPAAHAAVLCQWLAAGRGPELLADIDGALRAVPAEEAARAAAELFAAPATTVLLTSQPQPQPQLTPERNPA